MKRAIVIAALMLAFAARAQDAAPWWNVLTADAAFTPLSISNCVCWLDSSRSDTIILSGSNVLAWSDLSGSLNNATNANAGTAPVWLADSGEGKPAVVFYRETFDVILSARFSITSAHTIFAVFSCDDNERLYMCPVSYFVVVGDKGAPFYVRSPDRKSASYPLFDSGYWDGGGTATFGIGERFIYAFAMAGTGGTFFGRKNGVLDNSYLSYADNAALGLTFGRSSLGGQEWAGKIHEFLFFARTLSTPEIGQVEKYLGIKWGVSVAQ